MALAGVAEKYGDPGVRTIRLRDATDGAHGQGGTDGTLDGAVSKLVAPN